MMALTKGGLPDLDLLLGQIGVPIKCHKCTTTGVLLFHISLPLFRLHAQTRSVAFTYSFISLLVNTTLLFVF